MNRTLAVRTLWPMRRDRTGLAVYAGLYAGLAAALKGAGFVLFLWLARSLSTRDYATFGLAYALQTGLVTFALAGLVEALVGRLKTSRDADDERRMVAAANGTFTLMTIPSTAAGLAIFITFGGRGSNGWALPLTVVASGILLAFASLQAQIVRLAEKHLASMCFNYVVPFSGYVGGGIAFMMRRNVQAFFAGTVAGVAIALVTLLAAGLGAYGFTTALRDTRPLFRGVAAFMAIAVLGWLSGYGNTYAVQWFFASGEVARFTFALMVTSILQLVASALNQVWSPRFYRLVRDAPHDTVERQNHRFFRWQGLAMGITAGALLAVLPFATRLVGGNLVAYGSMRLELMLMSAGYVVFSPWWHSYNYYVVHGEGPEAMRVALAASAVGIAAWIALMTALGPVGIYAGFLVQMLARMLIIVRLARRRWSLSISWDGVVGGMALTLAGYAISWL